MKKSLKTILCLTLAAVILAAAVISASAIPAPMYIGDLDGDQKITILDATRIQRWLAGLEENLLDYYGTDQPQKLQEYIGDPDGDGRCTILDATKIQRMLAEIEPMIKDYTWAYYISPTRFYADYDSGKAYVGAPVTFTAEIPGYSGVPNPDNPVEPYTYEFRINGEVVQERSDQNTLTYTFTEPGEYQVTAVFYNALDVSRSNTLGVTGYGYPYFIENAYRVVAPYDLTAQPVIISARFSGDTETMSGFGPLVVRAAGGSGGYQYKFTIEGDFIESNGWLTETFDRFTTGWIDSGSVEMPLTEDRLPAGTVTVVARDSSGVCSEARELKYVNDIAVE